MHLFDFPCIISVRERSPIHARSSLVPPWINISLADIHCHNLPIQSPAQPISSSLYRVSKTGPRPPPGHRKGFGGCTFHFLLCRLLVACQVRSTSITVFSIHVESAKEPLIEYLRCLFTVLGRPIPTVNTCSSGFHITFSTSWFDEICLSG